MAWVMVRIVKEMGLEQIKQKWNLSDWEAKALKCAVKILPSALACDCDVEKLAVEFNLKTSTVKKYLYLLRKAKLVPPKSSGVVEEMRKPRLLSWEWGCEW